MLGLGAPAVTLTPQGALCRTEQQAAGTEFPLERAPPRHSRRVSPSPRSWHARCPPDRGTEAPRALWVSPPAVGSFINKDENKEANFRCDLSFVRIVFDTVYHRYRGISLQWVLVPDDIV